MTKFKVGDHVIFKGNGLSVVGDALNGYTGTIVRVHEELRVYSVEFHNPPLALHNCNGYAKEGRGWNARESQLELELWTLKSDAKDDPFWEEK